MNQSETFSIGGELTVHRLGYGGMSLASSDNMGWPDDPEQPKRILQRAIELGVDFIDTADMYGCGASECAIGEVVSNQDEAVVVATKGGIQRLAGEPPRKLYTGRPYHLRNAVLRSLARLRTDTIDLYQYHRPSIDAPFEETVEALAELKRQGTIRHIGLSNVSVDQLETAREIAEIATVQNRYSLLDREHEAVLQACEDAGIGFIAYSPTNKGRFGEKGQLLEEIATRHDANPFQIALAWLLQHSSVTLPIPGTSDLGHLQDNIESTNLRLSNQEMDRLAE